MKDNKVIVLFGKGNTGKTSTLKNLIVSLEPNEKKHLLNKDIGIDGHTRKVPDKICILNYKGKIIAIATAGDNKEEIDYAYNSIKKENITCDLYILACRTKGETIDCIKKLYGNKNIIWISKMFIDKKIKEPNEPSISENAFEQYCELFNLNQTNFICELIENII